MIEKPIARSANYRKQIIAGSKTRTKIRPAITGYEVLEEAGHFSLVEVCPKTGRTHQIRVHLASIGYPIAGDKVYKLKGMENAKNAARQLLHAKSLAFELFGKEHSFSVDPPHDFLDFWENLILPEIK